MCTFFVLLHQHIVLRNMTVGMGATFSCTHSLPKLKLPRKVGCLERRLVCECAGRVKLELVEVDLLQIIGVTRRKKASLLLPIVGYEEERRRLVVRVVETLLYSAGVQIQGNKEHATNMVRGIFER